MTASTAGPGDIASVSDRVAGSLLGLAVGDALGSTLEFTPPGRVAPIRDMVGGGPFDLAPGEWTDDTSMALCLGESLVACGGHDPEDQMRRYLDWFEKGTNSVTGTCFDIGATVSGALGRFRRTGDPLAGDPSPRAAGNGALMRLTPAVLFHRRDPDLALQAAVGSTLTTHAAPQTLAASDLFGRMLLSALAGASRHEVLRAGADGEFQAPDRRGLPYHADVAQVARDGGRTDPTDYSGGGYVVDALRIALHAFRHARSFEEGALLAVNRGGDADTNGAIYGQLAGAWYGLEGIPERWRSRLAWRDRLLELAGRLEAGPGGG